MERNDETSIKHEGIENEVWESWLCLTSRGPALCSSTLPVSANLPWSTSISVRLLQLICVCARQLQSASPSLTEHTSLTMGETDPLYYGYMDTHPTSLFLSLRGSSSVCPSSTFGMDLPHIGVQVGKYVNPKATVLLTFFGSSSPPSVICLRGLQNNCGRPLTFVLLWFLPLPPPLLPLVNRPWLKLHWAPWLPTRLRGDKEHIALPA